MSRDDPRFADYYRILDERDRRQREGLCDYHPDRPRGYWWTTKAGNRCGLCESCCAHWRENARDDPDLLPLLIVSCGDTPVTL